MDHLIRPNKSLPLWKSYLNGGGGIRILETLNQIVMEHFLNPLKILKDLQTVKT